MIHIVTDSTADLSPEIIESHFDGVTVHVIPLTVHFGDEEFRDGVDMRSADFYPRLREADVMPRTSQPSPASFVELYREISQPGDTILSYHISARLSGTIQSASLAARQVDDRKIEVIDTRSVSLGMALIAIQAARRVSEDWQAEQILAESRELIARHRILFLVDTLEYLQKNGRIGKAQALVGGLLSIKPILTIEDGLVAPLERVRGAQRAKERLFELVSGAIDESGCRMGAVLHASAEHEAEQLAERIQQSHPGVTLPPIVLGPTVGTHVGPGAVGVVLFEG